MKPFMNEDFLLENEVSKKLYFDYAAKMPIIDYHCHISPKEIAEDKKFKNITEIWLGGDHYKWRLMRANGVNEKYITGDGSDYEKFLAFASTLEKAIGNPVYHWSHLELQRYFDYHGVLNSKTAKEVYDLCNKKLETMSAKSIVAASNVKLLCTTDDPIDDLKYHDIIKEDKDFKTVVLPAWRPDKLMKIEKADFKDYIGKLAQVSSTDIKDIDSLIEAIDKRLDFFKSKGCVVSDHGLDYVMYEDVCKNCCDVIFKKGLNKEELSQKEVDQYKTYILLHLAKKYNELGFVMQLHYGCSRDNNGLHPTPDTGYDCMNNFCPSDKLIKMMDAMNKNGLPKTILYSLNPNDDELIDTVIGCFQDSSVVGKVQHGSAWWFNDNKTGMLKQMNSLANGGLLGNFLGMLTDSRSFISYPRHEYFRRIMCNYIGTLVYNGEYPYDEDNLKQIVEGISYNNTLKYFGFDKFIKD